MLPLYIKLGVDARANLHALEVTDTLIQDIKTTSGLTPKEVEVYGYSQDIGTDTLTVWDEPGQLWFGKDVSEDAAYEIASISHNNIQQIRDGQASYPDHSDIDLMTSDISPNCQFIRVWRSSSAKTMHGMINGLKVSLGNHELDSYHLPINNWRLEGGFQ